MRKSFTTEITEVTEKCSFVSVVSVLSVVGRFSAENKGGMMKKLMLVVAVFLSCSLMRAASGPDEYSVKVRVTSSCLTVVRDPRLPPYQRLDVVIEGKKFILEERGNHGGGVLVPGEYNAKVVREVRKTPYEYYQTYEFLFPDKRARQFDVVGQSE